MQREARAAAAYEPTQQANKKAFTSRAYGLLCYTARWGVQSVTHHDVLCVQTLKELPSNLLVSLLRASHMKLPEQLSLLPGESTVQLYTLPAQAYVLKGA
jgi:hypothetical protein